MYYKILIAETVVCIFLYCASNEGHKTPKSQDYPTSPGEVSLEIYGVLVPRSKHSRGRYKPLFQQVL